jgi:hypothetical protein
MKSGRLFMQLCAPFVITAFLLSGGAMADEQAPLPTVFTFSAGYKIDAPVPENVVALGVVKKCGREWCLYINRYDSAKMLPRVPTRYMHAMQAPYGGTNCSNGPIMTIKGTSDTGLKVELQPTQDGFSMSWADFRYRWTADSKAKDGYTLVEVSYKKAVLEQGVGFGFSSSEERKGKLAKNYLAYYYKGEIYHKTALTRVDGPWSYAPSSFDFRPYQEGDSSEVLLRSLPGDASVVKKYGKPMWVDSSIVLARGTEAIAPLVQEYGHDFNMDGCFNEFGHNKLMLPIGKEDITALIYVEYTPDKERGFPMISVGRYYR